MPFYSLIEMEKPHKFVAKTIIICNGEMLSIQKNKNRNQIEVMVSHM